MTLRSRIARAAYADPDLRSALLPLLRTAETHLVYHGTNAPPFDRFDPALIGSATDEGELGHGFYFSTDPNIGRGKATLLRARVHLRNPLRVAFPEWTSRKHVLVSEALGLAAPVRGRALSPALEAAGHDSVVLDYSPVGYRHQEIMVLDATQIRVVPE